METVEKNKIVAEQHNSMARTIAGVLRNSAFYGNDEVAADALSDAVVKLLTSALDAYDSGQAGLAGFCGMIARRSALDILKSHCNQSSHVTATNERASESAGEDETFGTGVVLSSEDNAGEYLDLYRAMETLKPADAAFIAGNMQGNAMHDGTSQGKVSAFRKRSDIVAQLRTALKE